MWVCCPNMRAKFTLSSINYAMDYRARREYRLSHKPEHAVWAHHARVKATVNKCASADDCVRHCNAYSDSIASHVNIDFAFGA